MGQYTQALEAKIEASQTEIAKLQTQIGRVKAELGAFLAAGDDKQADVLQKKRDETVRALERSSLRLEALRAEMPAAERQDAATRLAEIQGEANALAAANSAARAKYEQALTALLDCIDPAYEPALRRKDLQSKAEYLAEAFHLPLPTLPEVTQPEPAPLKTAYGRGVVWFEKLYQFYNPWQSKLSELQSLRKRERWQAERQAERESGARISL